MSNQLRIIGGEFKRRQLDFASIDGLRPTPDRLRETLFNWLMWDIQGAKVLDLCAGSGALSFEALSRGAAHVTMIEPEQKQVQYLQKNLQLLGTKQAAILTTTAQRAIPQLNEQFDIIFLDPPYALNLWQELAIQLQPLIHAETIIYVEANTALQALNLPQNWQLIKQSKVGIIKAGLFQVQTQNNTASYE